MMIGGWYKGGTVVFIPAKDWAEMYTSPIATVRHAEAVAIAALDAQSLKHIEIHDMSDNLITYAVYILKDKQGPGNEINKNLQAAVLKSRGVVTALCGDALIYISSRTDEEVIR